MQVRKFEAPTIKDAIELVKFHLGPDAIILSAKENVRGFGLMGESSVEVTAAVSESRLVKKAAAERKLDSKSREKYKSAPAHIQKQFIDKVFQQQTDAQTFVQNSTPNYTMDEGDERPVQVARPSSTPVVPKASGITAVRYAEIPEEGEVHAPVAPKAAAIAPATVPPKSDARPGAVNTQAPTPQKTVPETSSTHISTIQILKNEIDHLKGMLKNFQNVPQNFMSLHPGAEDGIPYELSGAFKKLEDAGINHQTAVNILKIANDVLPAEHRKKKAFVDGWMIKYLLEHVRIVEKPMAKRVHIFVGPTGQGKTSVVVKLACHLMMKEKKKVAMITGDSVKVGAPDQMRIYAQILNVPSALVTKQQDWDYINRALEGVDYILVDTPGVTLKGAQELDLLRTVLPPNLKEANIHFVQSIMARDQDAFETAERFQIFGFHDVIFTRLDEAVQHGLIYNFQQKFDVPVHSFGIGGQIPEDFEFATKERIVDLIFNLSNFRKERG